jgi:hypothetical protein
MTMPSAQISTAMSTMAPSDAHVREHSSTDAAVNRTADQRGTEAALAQHAGAPGEGQAGSSPALRAPQQAAPRPVSPLAAPWVASGAMCVRVPL